MIKGLYKITYTKFIAAVIYAPRQHKGNKNVYLRTDTCDILNKKENST